MSGNQHWQSTCEMSWKDLAFAGTILEEWLATVSAVPYFGKRYGINFGPFPFAPTWEHVKRYRAVMEHYGAVMEPD